MDVGLFKLTIREPFLREDIGAKNSALFMSYKVTYPSILCFFSSRVINQLLNLSSLL